MDLSWSGTLSGFLLQWQGAVALSVVCILIALFLYPRGEIPTLPDTPPTPPNKPTQEVSACLRTQFPEITFTRDDKEFAAFVKSLWSTQAQTSRPALVVKPRNVHELASVVKVLSEAVKRSTKELPVKFTVKSGGHHPEKGFASVDAGIAIDLCYFNDIAIAKDYKTVDLGPANTWGRVYRTLEKYGIAVAGGRASSVGVGGLILGGGLSFFSPQIGFVCDTVVNFEIVLADGSIVNANDTSHSDLATALRGGGNNFGIVTRFTLRTFQLTNVLFGHYFHTPTATDRLLKTFHDFGELEDKKATVIFVLSWVAGLPFHLPCSAVSYADPTNAVALSRFRKEWRFWSTVKPRSLASATDIIEKMSESNKQDLFHTTTFENDLETLQFAYLAFKDSLRKVRKQKIPGLIWSLCFQPLVPSATLHHASNAMGIDKADNKTLIVMHASIVWNSPCDDVIVEAAAMSLVDRVEDFARQKGVHHPWKYPNYCSTVQNPYAGFGPKRHQFLKDVSKKYDPQQIFQIGVPGHKL